jgi:hypothetical protein
MNIDDIVLVHLCEPKEQFWGKLVKLFEAGVVLRGINAQDIQRFKFQFLKDEQAIQVHTIFYPMRRIQAIALDEPVGNVPSVIQEVEKLSGLNRTELFDDD